MWRWLAKLLGDLIGSDQREHVFEPVISIRQDDGRLGALRCTRCGYCTYLEHPDGAPHSPCVPRAHKWVPIEVFQWESLPIAGKLMQPRQCELCGAHATTHDELERFGCPGKPAS
jgi:hypothetical protein